MLDDIQASRWKMIEVADLAPRTYPLVCALNESQILIYGGLSHKIDVCEGVILTRNSNSVADIERISQDGMSLRCLSQAQTTRGGAVVAVVRDELKNIKLIKFLP